MVMFVPQQHSACYARLAGEQMGRRGSHRLCFYLETSVPRQETNVSKQLPHKYISLLVSLVNYSVTLTVSRNSKRDTHCAYLESWHYYIHRQCFFSIKFICCQMQTSITRTTDVT